MSQALSTDFTSLCVIPPHFRLGKMVICNDWGSYHDGALPCQQTKDCHGHRDCGTTHEWWLMSTRQPRRTRITCCAGLQLLQVNFEKRSSGCELGNTGPRRLECNGIFREQTALFPIHNAKISLWLGISGFLSLT